MVTKWPAGLPLAPMALWHVAQLPAATPVCVKFAGIHAVVRWHESHDIEVARCRDGRPGAAAPLWQDAHVPGITPTCTEPRILDAVPVAPVGVAAADAAVGAADVVAGPVPRRAGIVAVAFADLIALPLPPSNDVVLWHCEQSAVVGG